LDSAEDADGGAVKHLVFISALAAQLLAPQNVSAEAEGILKPAGALECETSARDTSRTEKVTNLDCVLRLRDRDKSYAVTGKLYGSALYLVEGGVRVLWSVLAPTDNLEPTALAGDYDITSKFGFEHAQKRTDVLVGGMNDSVALELVHPPLETAINPSVRLTLAMSETRNRNPS
jgi:hypothetical protein